MCLSLVLDAGLGLCSAIRFCPRRHLTTAARGRAGDVGKVRIASSRGLAGRACLTSGGRPCGDWPVCQVAKGLAERARMSRSETGQQDEQGTVPVAPTVFPRAAVVRWRRGKSCMPKPQPLCPEQKKEYSSRSPLGVQGEPLVVLRGWGSPGAGGGKSKAPHLRQHMLGDSDRRQGRAPAARERNPCMWVLKRAP